MAVRIRMKKLGRTHRPFFRICAVDARKPRDGKVIEELGHYDPMISDTDARALLNQDRIDYWLSVGAQPSDNVKVLIKKYGAEGTHLEQQRAALEKIAASHPTPVVQKVAEPVETEGKAEVTEEVAVADDNAESAE